MPLNIDFLHMKDPMHETEYVKRKDIFIQRKKAAFVPEKCRVNSTEKK